MNGTRAHYLQHVPFEGLGSVDEWLRAHGWRVNATRLFAGDKLPELAQIDLLIVMGGPMGANDEREYPWLVAEKRLVASALQSGMPVLGVCLGAQLIAASLGERVYPNAEKEIGWFPVDAVENDEHGSGIFRFPSSFMPLHWHGDTFDLPRGAVHLARSAACENQAFQWGPSAIGLQFHLEMTPAALERLTVNCREELAGGTYVQSEDEILGAEALRYRSANELMDEVLDFLTGV